MTPTTETWLPIPGYEGFYEVSNLGRVRSVDRITDNGRGVRRRQRGRLLKVQNHPNSGRRMVGLNRDGDRQLRTVYSLVLAAFVGPRPDGMEACHNDGDATNDRLSNLRWDTRSANGLDKVRHGTHHNAIKTHCPRGHALQRPNLVPSALARGLRSCLTCAHERRRAPSTKGS